MTMPLKGLYSRISRMDFNDMRVPVGFPGEQRNMSLIFGSASTAFFTYRAAKDHIELVRRASRIAIELKSLGTHFIDFQTKPTVVLALSLFRSKLQVDFNDPNIVHLSTNRVHSVCRWCCQYLLLSTRFYTNPHK